MNEESETMPVRVRLRCARAVCAYEWTEVPMDGRTHVRSCPKCAHSMSRIVRIDMERELPPMSSETVSSSTVYNRAFALLQRLCALLEVDDPKLGQQPRTGATSGRYSQAVELITVALNSEAVRMQDAIREESLRSVTVSEKCDRPPAGWACTRQRGHEGPCAAVPRDVVLVSDPSAGPRDRFNALADKLVAAMTAAKGVNPEKLIIQALKDVYYEGHREGVSSAKAEWGEAVTDTDRNRAYRFIEVLVDDEDIVVRGDRAAIEARLRDEFAEVSAVARAAALGKRAAGNPFNEELERHRATLEKARLASDGPWDPAVLDAVWFLLAVAHQP